MKSDSRLANSSMAKVFVKHRRARPFWFGHPWVFAGAVDRVRGQVRDGDVVELCDDQGQLIGHGFYNSKSQIRVRLVSLWFEGPVTRELILERVDRALDLRRDLLRLDAVTNAVRLIHSEGDGLPGLVADRFGDHIVVQVTSRGIAAFVQDIVGRLVERLSPSSVTERVARIGLDEEGLVRRDAVLFGTAPSGPVEVVEHGVRFWCDILAGQKTGFFCDQRDNRRLLAPLVRDRAVLDAFCYVGGFGLNAAIAGARSVHMIDSSEPAIALARRGAESNGVLDRTTFEEANVLRALDHYGRDGRRFDVVILDPPKLVHRLAELNKGLRLYYEINWKAVQVLNDGGVLLTCSCSQHVSESDFEDMLSNVAKESGTRFQLLHRGNQPPDHPVMLPHAESRYLKCHVYRVVKGKVDAGRAPAVQEPETAGSSELGEPSERNAG
jgi:23S rRNA (cytosine1962-C5)-methyltransferase